MHFHICRPCGAVWDHTTDPNWTREQFKGAHTCPMCRKTACTTKWNAKHEAEAACKGPVTQREIDNARYCYIADTYGDDFAELGDPFMATIDMDRRLPNRGANCSCTASKCGRGDISMKNFARLSVASNADRTASVVRAARDERRTCRIAYRTHAKRHRRS